MGLFKKSKADKVPFIHPNFEPMYQVDFIRSPGDPKGDPETNIHKYGCRFMCELAICQFINNKTFSKQQILQIYHAAVGGDWGANVMQRDCTLGANESALMSGALKMLGDDKHYISQVMVKGVNSDGDWNINNYTAEKMPGPGNVYFVIVDFNTNGSADYGGHHFVLFNSIGEIIYDPANGTVHTYKNVNRLLFYKVTNK
jgi:hypothetical protein